jgi:hypothetical protein
VARRFCLRKPGSSLPQQRSQGQAEELAESNGNGLPITHFAGFEPGKTLHQPWPNRVALVSDCQAAVIADIGGRLKSNLESTRSAETTAFRQRRAADTARWRERLHRGAGVYPVEVDGTPCRGSEREGVKIVLMKRDDTDPHQSALPEIRANAILYSIQTRSRLAVFCVEWTSCVCFAADDVPIYQARKSLQSDFA